MRTLTWLIISFICIALPIQGMASLLPAKNACPTAVTASKADCCKQIDNLKKADKVCKAEPSCQLVSLALPSQLKSPLLFATASKLPLLTTPLPANLSPASTWRPPAVI